MGNSVDRKNAIRLYLTGTIGQITVIAVIVYLLRNSRKLGVKQPKAGCVGLSNICYIDAR